MKRPLPVRTRFIIGSFVVDFLLAALVLVLAIWASRPILWPSDPLFPRYFFSYFIGVYGWLLAGCAAGLSTILQAVFTKWTLRFVGQPPSRWLFLIVGLIVVCIVSSAVVSTLIGDFAVSQLLVLVFGILLPAFWPSYVVVSLWERQHRQVLLLRGFSYQALAKR